MSDFSLNEIIGSIGTALAGEFPNVTVYAEPVEQGISLPCFFVQCLSASSKPYLHPRVFRKYHFAIQYIPADNLNPANECLGVSDRLFGCLELIGKDGEFFRGTNLHQEYTDKILNFFVDYGCFVTGDADTAADNEMDRMEGRVSTKGG